MPRHAQKATQISRFRQLSIRQYLREKMPSNNPTAQVEAAAIREAALGPMDQTIVGSAQTRRGTTPIELVLPSDGGPLNPYEDVGMSTTALTPTLTVEEAPPDIPEEDSGLEQDDDGAKLDMGAPGPEGGLRRAAPIVYSIAVPMPVQVGTLNGFGFQGDGLLYPDVITVDAPPVTGTFSFDVNIEAVPLEEGDTTDLPTGTDNDPAPEAVGAHDAVA